MGKGFCENADGVHLMAAVNSEYSLCGDAFDIDSTEPDLGMLVPTTKTRVTCERCIAEIFFDFGGENPTYRFLVSPEDKEKQ